MPNTTRIERRWPHGQTSAMPSTVDGPSTHLRCCCRILSARRGSSGPGQVEAFSAVFPGDSIRHTRSWPIELARRRLHDRTARRRRSGDSRCGEDRVRARLRDLARGVDRDVARRARPDARVSRLVLANTSARIGSVESWTDRISLVRREGMQAVVERAAAMWFSKEFRRGMTRRRCIDYVGAPFACSCRLDTSGAALRSAIQTSDQRLRDPCAHTDDRRHDGHGHSPR